MASTSDKFSISSSSTGRRHAWLSRLLAPYGIDDDARLQQAVGGKIVLVTGASFGIGESLVRRLAAADARVILAARSEERLSELVDHIRNSGGRADAICVDLSNSENVERAAAEVVRISGGVDVVVHNAGKSIRRSLALSLDRFHDFQRLMAVNYLGPVQLQLALLPSMFERGGGQIINVSSLGVRLPPAPRWSAYLASKSAFDIWLRSSAPELRHRGVHCTSIYLGLVHTRMSAPTPDYRLMPGQTPDEAAQVLCRAIIHRELRIAPWWLTPVEWLSTPLAEPIEYVFSRMFLKGSDTPAARGEKIE